MTPVQKVTAVKNYLRDIAVYPVSVKDANGKWTSAYLAEEYGVPSFITNRWDSYTSPLELEKIGAKLGYPLRSMYFDYETGTAEWRRYHMYAESVEDPTIKFEFCPLSSTGYTYEYQDIDYDTYAFYEAQAL